MLKLALRSSAVLVACALLPLSMSKAHAGEPSRVSNECPNLTSPLAAQAAELPRTYVRLSGDSLREHESDAGRPDGAVFSVAVNVRNACGGSIILPDFSVLTFDPMSLPGDRLVRISHMPSKSFLVDLSPSNGQFPTSLPARVPHQHSHDSGAPAIAMSYVLEEARLPAHPAPQKYMPVAYADPHPQRLADYNPRPAVPKAVDTPAPAMPTEAPLRTPPPVIPQPVVLAPVPVAKVVATPAPIPADPFSMRENIIARNGGKISLPNGVAVIVAPGALRENVALKITYKPEYLPPPTTEEYTSLNGVAQIEISAPQAGLPQAPAVREQEAKNDGIRIVMLHASGGDANAGLLAMRARYLDSGEWLQTVSSAQAFGKDVAADFSANLVRNGGSAWFSLQQYVAPAGF